MKGNYFYLCGVKITNDAYLRTMRLFTIHTNCKTTACIKRDAGPDSYVLS